MRFELEIILTLFTLNYKLIHNDVEVNLNLNFTLSYILTIMQELLIK